MPGKTLFAAGWLTAVLLCATAAHAAPDCPLKQVASLDITTGPGGHLLVPATFGGDTKKLVVEFGAAFPEMAGSYATRFANYVMPTRLVGIKVATGDAAGVVKIDRMMLGGAVISDTRMLRVDHADFGEPDAVGTLTLSLLRDYDVELDLQHNTLNLFSQDHCAVPGAYWSKSYASLHFDSDQDGHITFPMSLDGKRVNVGIVTDPGHASMTMAAAHRLFGLDADSPGVVREKGTSALPIYDYAFKALSAGNFVFTDPHISIVGSDPYKECRSAPPPLDVSARFPEFAGSNCYGGTDVNLGLAELRRLRLYFSLRDDTLYFTAAHT